MAERGLRDLTRLRKAQANERARSIQRLEKVLQDAGIKLSSVASTTYSKSARAMLDALLGGINDPDELAELAKARMRQKIPQLGEALASRFRIEHHGVMVAQLLAHIDTLDAAIANLSDRISDVLAPHQDVIDRLCTIPGVHVHAAQVLIAECGLDMTRFPTVKHFASWAGACPGHHESAGRRRSGRTRPGPRWLTDMLTECARAAVRTKGSYLAAHYTQLRGRRGEPIALGATTSPTTTSEPTGNTSATHPNTAPAASGASSKRSATRSSSSNSNPPPDHKPSDRQLPAAPPARSRLLAARANSGDSQASLA